MLREDISVSSHPPQDRQLCGAGYSLTRVESGLQQGGEWQVAKSSCEPQWAWPSFTWFSLLPLPVGFCNPKTWDTEAAPSGCQRQVQKHRKRTICRRLQVEYPTSVPTSKATPGAKPSHPCLDKYKHFGFTISAFALAQTVCRLRASLQHLKAIWSLVHLVAHKSAHSCPRASAGSQSGILFSQVPSTQ